MEMLSCSDVGDVILGNVDESLVSDNVNTMYTTTNAQVGSHVDGIISDKVQRSGVDTSSVH